MCYLYMYTCIYIYMLLYGTTDPNYYVWVDEHPFTSLMFTAAPGFHPHGDLCANLCFFGEFEGTSSDQFSEPLPNSF